MTSPDLSRLQIAREGATPSPARSRRRYYIAGAVLLALLVIAALAVVRTRALKVSVARAELRGGAGAGGLTANGYVVARTQASVSSKLPGRLALLSVDEGDRIAAGAVIARLEAAEYEAGVRQAAAEALGADAVFHEAESQLAQARRAHERAVSLHAQELIAEQALEDAATARTVAEARVRAAAARREAARQGELAARANLANTVIRAPFTGTVLRRDAEVGEVVAPAVAGGGFTRGAVVTMADLSTLEVEVDVNEAYIGGITSAQPAEIVLDAYPGVPFPGHVRQVVPTADRQKATVLVRVAIDAQDPRILPEMGARVVFRDTANSAAAALPARVYVPAAAVRSEGERSIVWVVRDGRASRVEIEAGPVSADEREVRRGLSGGEQLILDPPAELVEGARVEPVPATSTGVSP